MMFRKIRMICTVFCLLCLCVQVSLAGQEKKARGGKPKLAVVKLQYDDFEPEDQEVKETISQAFYDSLKLDDRIEIMSDTLVAERLRGLVIDPAGLDTETNYINAGRELEAEYVVVGELSKIGALVEVDFRIYNLIKGNQNQYTGIKTIDRFVGEEIPPIVAMIRNFLPEKRGKNIWPLVLIAVIGGGTTYLVGDAIFGSEDSRPPQPLLPTPPDLPGR